MTFLLCLLAAAVLVGFGDNLIKARAKLLYGIATVLAVLLAVGTALDLPSALPAAVDLMFWRPLANGSLATALWAAVMYAGAVKNGSALQRKVMPIRGELSILASILTLGHNLATGQEYFVRLFTGASELPLNQFLATVCSLVMLAVMLPLFVTSFPSVRRKMEARAWKKLQRWAYLFYGLTYVHVLLLFFPIAQAGKTAALVNLLIFTVVFLGYGALRVSKAMVKGKAVPAVAAVLCGVLVVVNCLPPHVPQEPVPPVAESTAPAEKAKPEQKPAPAPEPGAERKYQDGTFSGKGRGYAGPVKVDVTIQNDVIVDIVITEQVEDEPYWTRSLITLDRIVDQQKINVENVAGATKSVKGIKRAVKDALKHAKI